VTARLRRSPVWSPSSQQPACAGFGLLEAIVSLALLGTTGLALFAWVQQNLQTAVRLERVQAEAELKLTVSGYVETLNPALQASGEIDIGDVHASWQSIPIEPSRPNGTFTEGIGGPWRVGLYKVTIQAARKSQSLAVSFSQLQAGTKRVTSSE
jgi:general secretion pathway protein I